MNNQQYEEQLIKRIENLILEFVKQVSASTPPVFTHMNRSTWGNVDFNSQVGLCVKDENIKLTHVRFDSWKSVNKLRMMVKVISMIHQLLTSGRYATKRDLYYQNVDGIGSQAALDDAVDNVSCMLQIPRWHLHILATSKGCMAGDLSFLDADGSFVDCNKSKNGILVPSHIEALQQLHTTAEFLLVIEKDAVFQKLLDDDFSDHIKPSTCILVTGKGFPDINTRMLLNRIWSEYQLPMAILVDADSYGIEIMCVYKFGSRSLSFEAKYLTAPAINWLGILPSDIDRLAVPKEVLVSMSQADKDKILDLMSRPYFKEMPELQRELQVLLTINKKAEIECLDAISPYFLSRTYLPAKLKSILCKQMVM